MRASTLVWLFAALLLDAVAAGSAGAQERAASVGRGTITGRAVAEGTGTPLVAANVAIRRADDSSMVATTLTGEGGRFVRQGLAEGTYLIEIALIGHTSATRQVLISADRPVHDLGAVALLAQAVALEGVVATGERSEVSNAVDRTVYNVRQMPTVQGGSATDALRAIPELEVDVDDNVRARGGEPQIFLDGRPLPMQGAARTAFLQSLRADRIERIEYIPNPSARYEADGQGGIVNIVLRRDAQLGLSGSVSANAGSRGTQGFSTRINYQLGPVTFFGGGTLNLSQSNTTISDLRQNLLATPTTFLQQDADRRRDGLSGGGDLTAELKLSSRSTIWGIVRGNSVDAEEEALSQFIHLDADRTVTERYERENLNDNGNANGYGAIGFRHVIEAQRNEMSAEVRYNSSGNDLETRSLHFAQDVDGQRADAPPGLTSVANRNRDAVWSVQGDLSKPLGPQTQIEVGYRGNFRGNTSRQDGEIYRPETDEGLGFEDGFRYSEDSHAGYLNMQHRVGPVGLQGGLRVEQVDGRVSASVLADPVMTEHRGLFPSAAVSYDIEEGKQLRLAYAKRIQRPNAGVLNPLNSTPADPFNRSVGNPGLTPADLHELSFDASWTGAIGTIRVSPHLFRGKDLWDGIRTIDEDGVITLTPRNIASAGMEGMNVMASLREMGRFSGNLGFNVRRLWWEVTDVEGARSDEITGFTANLSVTTRITPSLRLQTTAAYSPRDGSPQGYRSEMRQLNLAMSQRVYDDRGTITLSLVDPFDLSRTTFTSTNEGHQQTGRTSSRVRRATLSFSLNFGRAPQSTRRVVADESSSGGGMSQ